MSNVSRNRRFILCLCGALAPLLSALPAQSVRLLKQIYPRTGPNPGSNPSSFVALGSHVYSRVAGRLVRYDASGANARTVWPVEPAGLIVAGQQLFFQDRRYAALWRSDGTEHGTYLLASASNAYSAATEPTRLGSKLVFAASNAAGRELWITDGSVSGPVPLVDIRPGSGSSNPRALIAHGSEVFFLADDGTSGEELWRTDGTASGTVRVTDVRPGAAAAGIQHLVSDGRGTHLWFFAADGRGGHDLWRTDGTTAGSTRVAPAVPHATLSPFGNAAMYLQTRNNRIELWSSDGTAAGTRRVKDVGPATTIPTGIRPHGAGGYFYFAVPDAGGNGQLWRSDGSTSGTIPLTAVGHLPPGSVLESLGVRVHFAGGRGSARGIELWSSDGTVAGTFELKDINPTGSSVPGALVAIGTRIWMAADDGTHGVEPWLTDGTAAGTRLVDNVANWGSADEVPTLTMVDDQAWFLREAGNIARLWQTDGSSAGTTSVPVIGSSNPLRAVMAGVGRVFFASPRTPASASLIDLWASDGTVAGTGLFRANLGMCSDMVDLGDVAVFGAGTYSHELWSTNGTPAGTRSLGHAISTLRVQGSRFARVGTRAWFIDGLNRLAVTDGTRAGTAVVAATAGHRMASEPIRYGDRVAFTTINELVFTDGTVAGTSVIPINTSAGLLTPRSFAASSSGVFVQVMNLRRFESELWFSDGTTAGTRKLVSDRSFYLTGGRVWRDRFYFTWSTPAAGNEPWVSDGTARGTIMLRDLEPGPASSNGGWGIGVGSRYFYFRGTRDLDSRLWRTDGTGAGTRPLAGPSASDALGQIGGRLLFVGEDPALGNQLFAVDLYANTKVIGRGCASANRVPRLAATDPALGGQLRLDLDSPHPTQTAVALFGLPTTHARYTRLPGGCVIVPDLAQATLPVVTRTDAAGRARVTLPVPNTAVLIGARLYVQAAVGATPTAPLGTDLTPGLSLTLGQ